MKKRYSQPSKFGLHKPNKKLKETTHNRTYKFARKLKHGIDCLICMGLCGTGPYKANRWKRNSGKMPKYKNRKKGIKNLIENI